MGMAGCFCCCFNPFSYCWSHCAFSLFCYLLVVDFQTLLINGFGTFCDLLHPFVCVEVCLRHWITYLILLCLYDNITCVWLHLESISLKHFIFWMLCLTAMCFILDYVVWFLLSIPNVRMLSFSTYHGHGRLSHWQLFLNLCFSMLYCTFTILLHLSHCAL